MHFQLSVLSSLSSIKSNKHFSKKDLIYCKFFAIFSPSYDFPLHSFNSILSSAYFNAMLITSLRERLVFIANSLYSSCNDLSTRIVMVTHLSSFSVMTSFATPHATSFYYKASFFFCFIIDYLFPK